MLIPPGVSGLGRPIHASSNKAKIRSFGLAATVAAPHMCPGGCYFGVEGVIDGDAAPTGLVYARGNCLKVRPMAITIHKESRSVLTSANPQVCMNHLVKKRIDSIRKRTIRQEWATKSNHAVARVSLFSQVANTGTESHLVAPLQNTATEEALKILLIEGSKHFVYVRQ